MNKFYQVFLSICFTAFIPPSLKKRLSKPDALFISVTA